MDKLSYAIGLVLGNQLASMGAEINNIDDFGRGVNDALNKKSELKPEEAQKLVHDYFTELENKRSAGATQEGKDFLTKNAARPEVTTLPSGLQYEVITEGTGKKAKATDRVRCHYEGTLLDGTMFDSSVKRGEPAVFGVNQVIQGWVEALQLMSEGSKWRLYIPSDLAYGAQGAGSSIPPHATLIFEVELIEVI